MGILTETALLASYDDRQWRANLGDTNTPVVGPIMSNDNMIEIALMAEAEVLSAAITGERYTQSQLEVLADDETSAGGAMLRRLCADIAYAMVISRRGRSAQDVERLCPRYGLALRQLEQLRQGVRIFPGIPEAAEAGLPSTVDNLTNQTKRPRLFSDAPADRIWPHNPCRGTQYGDCC